MAGGRGAGLTRESVLDAALAIIDRDGADALSMRRLGAELKTTGMAVYYHFSNKAEVLSELAGFLLDGMDRRLPDPADVDCADWLVEVARSYVSIVFEHPNISPILLSHPFRTRARHEGEMVLAVLASNGIEPADGVALLDAVEAFALGFGLISRRPVEWLNPEVQEVSRYPHLAAGLAGNRRSLQQEFELGARVLVAGLLAGFQALPDP
jgi:AcrR family transcriptional regulator